MLRETRFLQGGGALGDVRQIGMEGLDPRIADTEIMVACDVTNPLTGPHGASFVYGPQKGADRGDGGASRQEPPPIWPD